MFEELSAELAAQAFRNDEGLLHAQINLPNIGERTIPFPAFP